MSFIPKNSNKTQKRSYFLGEIAIAIAIGAISIGEIAIAISPISIAIDASREIGEIAIAISSISIAIVIDVDRRSFGDRRDPDRGASVWIVPFGSVCGSEQ